MNQLAFSFGQPGLLEIGMVVAVLVLFVAPKQVPKLARAFGMSITEWKKGLREAKEFKKEILADGEELKEGFKKADDAVKEELSKI